MYLRSRNLVRLGARSVRDSQSQISFEESVTQEVPLATIVEEFRDNHSKSSLSMASKGMALAIANLKYNMTIECFANNALGAKIYIDPLGRFAKRIEDHVINFVQEMPFNVQGDRYMDPYGTMYILTENPHNMDKWGIIRLDDKGKQPMGLSEQPPRVNPKNMDWMIQTLEFTNWTTMVRYPILDILSKLKHFD